MADNASNVKEADGSAQNFFLAKGYKYFQTVPHFDDTENEDEWQDEVYGHASRVAQEYKAERILDRVMTESGVSRI